MNFSAKRSSDVVESFGIVTVSIAKPETLQQTIINMVKGARSFYYAYTYTISQHRNFDSEKGRFERYDRLLNALIKDENAESVHIVMTSNFLK